MKTTILIIVSILMCTFGFGQIEKDEYLFNDKKITFDALSGTYDNPNVKSSSDADEISSKGFERDCSSDFWTINGDGHMQQWSLTNDSISGGEVILQSDASGIAFCGDEDSPTFYGSHYPNAGITYYDSLEGWVDIPTPFAVLNNGGHKNDQYYMRTVTDQTTQWQVSRVIYHFDGTDLSTIDSLENTYISVADIAVDTLGQAWVFEGDSLFTISNINVYDKDGLINSYDISFDVYRAYGSFFLNEILYVGISDSIYPILIEDEKATRGEPIVFPYLDYKDMASCQGNPLMTSISELSTSDVEVFPNPTFDIINIPEHISIDSVEILDMRGNLLQISRYKHKIDVSGLHPGVYFIKMHTPSGVVTKRVIKQ